jgi:hypothetical protein
MMRRLAVLLTIVSLAEVARADDAKAIRPGQHVTVKAKDPKAKSAMLLRDAVSFGRYRGFVTDEDKARINWLVNLGDAEQLALPADARVVAIEKDRALIRPDKPAKLKEGLVSLDEVTLEPWKAPPEEKARVASPPRRATARPAEKPAPAPAPDPEAVARAREKRREAEAKRVAALERQRQVNEENDRQLRAMAGTPGRSSGGGLGGGSVVGRGHSCGATTRKGAPCRRWVVNGVHCYQHGG